MSEEIRELKARITSLEVNVHKLVAFASGVGQSVAQAAAVAVECGTCKNAIEGRRSCQEDVCPCGLPNAVLEPEEEA